MVSTECGWCGRFAHMQVWGPGATHQVDDGPGWSVLTIMGTFTCAACHRILLARITLSGDSYRYSGGLSGRDALELLDDLNDQLHWLPLHAPGKGYRDVPPDIAGAADEGHRAMQAKCFRSAVLMARAVIEATAKAKEITTGTLNTKIEAMANAGLIRGHVREAAHEIRHLGNDMAHGDLVVPVAAEDAELVLTLMDEVLLEVFQSPARVAQAKEKRLARKASDTAAPAAN